MASIRFRRTLPEICRLVHATNPQIRVVSTKYAGVHSKLLCVCRCGQRWRATWHNLSRGSGCPKCGYAKQAKARRLDLRKIETLVRKISPSLRVVSSSYTGSKEPLALSCKVCKTRWQTTWNALRTNRKGCKVCVPVRAGKSEEAVRQVLEQITGWRFPKARPVWLKGKSTYPMELDGYNEQHRVAFEYQGTQHYVPIFGRKAFEITKRNDERKRVLCYSRGILLIRVPYWKRDTPSFLRSKLQKAGLPCAN